MKNILNGKDITENKCHYFPFIMIYDKILLWYINLENENTTTFVKKWVSMGKESKIP